MAVIDHACHSGAVEGHGHDCHCAAMVEVHGHDCHCAAMEEVLGDGCHRAAVEADGWEARTYPCCLLAVARSKSAYPNGSLADGSGPSQSCEFERRQSQTGSGHHLETGLPLLPLHLVHVSST